MIKKESLSTLFKYLSYHAKSQIYFEPETGQPFHGYHYPFASLKIISDDIVYLAEENDLILMSISNNKNSANNNQKISIHEQDYTNELTIRRYQSPRKQLPFPITEYTPLSFNVEETNIKKAHEYNWSLYEFVVQVSSVETFNILNEMSLTDTQKNEIISDLNTSDNVNPCKKVIDSPHIQTDSFEDELISRIKLHLSKACYQDINGNYIGDHSKDNVIKVGPLSVSINATGDNSTILEACTLHGHNIDLSKIAKWYPFLNKKMDRDFLHSELGLSAVIGALKQAGIIGHDSYVTNEIEIIRILEHEF